MKIVKGDLIEMAKLGEFNYIMHGCNCFNMMGAGIAKTIANEFPEVSRTDALTSRGSIYKLGNYTTTKVFAATEFQIVNLYTQYTGGPDFKIWALQSALYKFRMSRTIGEYDEPPIVGVPWIGCGIGGGNKKEVEKVLKEFSNHVNLVVVEYATEPEEVR